jgi:peptidyl-prolyl cis-trans isomerase D
MLQTIRDRAQGWITGVIVGLLVVAFALWGIESYLGNSAGPDVAAKVNGVPITQEQLNFVYQRMRQSWLAQVGSQLSFDQTLQAQLKAQALQQLITSQVLSQAAIRQGYRVHPLQLDAVIMQLPAFQVNGQFSPERFQEILNKVSYSQHQFVSDLENTLLINQPQLGILSSQFALPGEIDQAMQLKQQKRDIEYTILPTERFLQTTQLPAQTLQDYYQQHLAEFQSPAKVRIEYVELSAPQLQHNVQVSDQELQQYYNENIQTYAVKSHVLPFAQVRHQIEQTLLQQKLQQLFSDQSEQLSQLVYTNPNSLAPAAKTLGLQLQVSDYFANTGGTNGITANPKVVAAAFSDNVLKQSNNSDLIPLDDKTVLVLRTKEYQPAAPLPFSAVKGAIGKVLRQRAAQQQVKQVGEQLLAQLRQGENPQKIAEQHHLQWISHQAVNRQTSVLNGQILKLVFSLPANANKTHPAFGGLTLSNGNYVLVSVTGVTNGVSAQLSSPEQQTYREEIENSMGQLDYELYVSSLMKQAKVVTK